MESILFYINAQIRCIKCISPTNWFSLYRIVILFILMGMWSCMPPGMCGGLLPFLHLVEAVCFVVPATLCTPAYLQLFVLCSVGHQTQVVCIPCKHSTTELLQSKLYSFWEEYKSYIEILPFFFNYIKDNGALHFFSSICVRQVDQCLVIG